VIITIASGSSCKAATYKDIQNPLDANIPAIRLASSTSSKKRVVLMASTQSPATPPTSGKLLSQAVEHSGQID
jgi:hypothetical protein